jgi:hypothetical protein
MTTKIGAEAIVGELLKALSASKAGASQRTEKVKPGPWSLDQDSPDQVRERLRSLVVFIAQLDLWRLPVPKCWPYHPRTVRGLLAAKARWEQIDASDNSSAAVGFYTLTLRDVKEQLISFEIEREHQLGAQEVATIDDLEEFLRSAHFDAIYGPLHGAGEAAVL